MIFYPQLPKELWIFIYKKEHEMKQISVNKELYSVRIGTENANNRLQSDWMEDHILEMNENRLWTHIGYLNFIKNLY